MSQQWVGSVVSIDCGESLGVYQGQVSSVDHQHQTISLVKAFRNGMQSEVPEVTICAQDIMDLSILKIGSDSKAEFVTNLVDTATNVESSNDDSNTQHGRKEERRRTQSVSDIRRKNTTPKKMEKKKRHEKDEACFSAPIDSYILENEFDFEKNLALFDKRAVFDEIDAATKPDVVRWVEGANRRTQQQPQRYRCDENVLEHEPAVLRQISIPNADTKEYVTDTGLIVPSIQPKLRAQLFSVAEKHGLSVERQLEMIGRAVCDMALQLLGGSYRLNPQNKHQRPVVVVICGHNFQGLQGMNCGRHIANHGADIVLYFPKNGPVSPLLSTELALFKLSDGKFVNEVDRLPSGLVDLIVWAADDHDLTHLYQGQPWHQLVVEWAKHGRAPILALDPPVQGTSIEPRWSISPGLPLALGNVGNIYLCDIGLPKKVFLELGINYSSPFGPKSLIPLHNKSR